MADSRYGVKLNAQKMPVSGGGPRWDYVCDFLDSIETDVQKYVENDLKL